MSADLADCPDCGYGLKLVPDEDEGLVWVCDCPLFDSLVACGARNVLDPNSSFLGAKDTTAPAVTSPSNLAADLFDLFSEYPSVTLPPWKRSDDEG